MFHGLLLAAPRLFAGGGPQVFGVFLRLPFAGSSSQLPSLQWVTAL